VEDVFEDLSAGYGTHWRRYVVGDGALESTGSKLRFVIPGATRGQYSNAQIDDYQGLPRRRFLWRPPLRLTVRARFSHRNASGATANASGPATCSQQGLRGTAGFGFWNDPFMMTGARVPALPRAVWFFHASPPSNMKLDLDTPGQGWKAVSIDALRPAALLLAPVALPAAILMNVPRLYRALWPPIQRALKVGEAAIQADMTAWHTYVLEWGSERARFYVDSARTADPLLDAPSPRGPLGFVMWLDNQYLVATPWGRFRWGLLDVEDRQWMEIDRLSIETVRPFDRSPTRNPSPKNRRRVEQNEQLEEQSRNGDR
jgi:hypothetical protein